MSRAGDNRRLRRRVDELEQEIAVLRDRARLRVAMQTYPPGPIPGTPERALLARDPQPKQGWLRSLWGAFVGLFG